MLLTRPAMAAVPVRILLIRPWVVRADNVRSRLAEVGYAPRITRVDFEAALEAALWRGNFDLIVFDPATPKLTRAFVEGRMREHGVRAPLVELTGDASFAQQARALLLALQN